MINWIWLGLILAAVTYAALFEPANMQLVSDSILSSARTAVDLVIGLVGAMVFFLGLTRVAFDGGLRSWIARNLAPLTRRLFPEVPPDHPAMGAMVMNMSSNMMGLGNSATPFGLKAMRELSLLNGRSGVASNAMILFMAINTSAITVFPPFGTIAVRAQTGSADPWAIWVPTLIATTCSTLAAVAAYYGLGRLPMFQRRADTTAARAPEPIAEDLLGDPGEAPLDDGSTARPPMGRARAALIIGFFALACWGMASHIYDVLHNAPAEPASAQLEAVPAPDAASIPAESSGRPVLLPADLPKALLSGWLMPLVIVGLLLIGVAGHVNVYDSMVKGAREGLQVGVMIVPYLVAILVAVGMFRASGALDLMVGVLDPITTRAGVPAEVMPMALLRPLSASGALGIMAEILTVHGPDSFIGYLTSTLMGSTETTFYVLALYLGAAGVVDGRHALAACLIGDLGGFVGAVAACHWFFG